MPSMFRKKAACLVHRRVVFRMEKEGASLSAIARAIGTNKRHVKKFLRDHGVTRAFPFSKPGKDHPEWKGGRHVDRAGYISVYSPDHPYCRKYTKHVLEHRLVMEQHLGRYLLPTEVVHHKNGIKTDNRIENLMLFEKNSEHLAHELKGRCPRWTEDGRRRIREAFARSQAHPRFGIGRPRKARDVEPLPENSAHCSTPPEITEQLPSETEPRPAPVPEAS